jgi:hypothetical protein
MRKAVLTFAMAIFCGSWFVSPSVLAQVVEPAKKAAHIEVTEGPEIELNQSHLAIIRWTSNNPGGTPEHFGVVHYGTDPKNLNLTAKSHIRLNQGHEYTDFRVRMDDLAPKTTYYYTVDSLDAHGVSDGVKSSTKSFTTR